jgi:alpha-dioxygenase
MVHDWVGHYDDESDTGGVVLDKGKANGCPMGSFKFRKTKERSDGHYNCFRTQWWDASFLYGNTKAQADSGRAHVGGKLKINTQHPNTLPNDGNVNTTGDNKNSWVGVALLQEIFLKEHNAIVEDVAKQNPVLSDDELYGVGKMVIAALVAKIHTTDWTVELLKTRQLEIVSTFKCISLRQRTRMCLM